MPSTAGYDAFISYSHRQDDWLAPALQSGLERFATPWYRMRRLRVFRDAASLSANPGLWASIEAALLDSRWFILLASPEAARSSWVDREVAWWLAQQSTDRILLVATSVHLKWDNRAGDWAYDTPVPPSLRGAFRVEPLWVDLTGLGPGRGIRVPDEDLAALAAPLRGVDRDTLIGEHLRQHRRAMRAVRSVIATLSALLVFAVAATVIAVGQRDTARTEARIATARELAALSGSVLGTHLDTAQLLAVGAYQMDHNTQTESALLQAAAASPQLVRDLQAGGTVTALASSADGNVLMAGTADGHLSWFDLKNGHQMTVRATSGAISMLSVSADGLAVVAADSSQVVAWLPGLRGPVHIGTARPPKSVAISPSGARIAVLEAPGTPAAQSTSLQVGSADGNERTITVSSEYGRVGFPSDTSLALVNEGGPWQRLNIPSLRVTAASSAWQAPGDAFLPGASDDSGYSGFTKVGFVTVWHTAPGEKSSVFLYGTVPDAPGSFLTIRADGAEAAVIESGTIDLTPITAPHAGVSPGTTSVQLAGDSDTSLVTFLGTSGRVASAAGAMIAIWDPRQASRLSTSLDVTVPFSSEAGPPPVLLSSPHGKWLALVGGGGTGAWLIPSGHGRKQAAGQEATWDLPIRDGDKPLLLGTTTSATGRADKLVLADTSGRVLRTWPAPSEEDPVAAGMLPQGTKLAVVWRDGSVRVYDVLAGTVRQLARGSGPGVYVSPGDAAVSTDGSGAVVAASAQPGGLSASISVKYVDLRTGTSRQVSAGAASGVLFTSSSLVIQRTGGSLETWDLTGRRMVRELPGIGAPTTALAVSPDGTLLARLRDDGTASLTDLTTGNVLTTFTLPFPAGSTAPDPWRATAIMFTPDGHYLLTATSGGELTRWTIAPPDLVRSICATVGHALTAAQWRQYAGTSPPATMPCSPH